MSEKKRNKSGLPGVLILLVIIGAGAGALHYLGKLEPLVDKLKGMTADNEKVVEKVAPEPVVEKPVEPPVAPAEKVVEKPDVPVKEESKLTASYRAKFKAPKIGSKLTLTLKSKAKVTGIIEHLDEKGLTIKTDKVQMSLAREQLASISRARCYEDDYVKYMVALNKKKEADTKRRAALLDKKRSEYQAFLERTKKNKTATDERGSRKEKAVSIDDVDFVKWMEENGSIDLLKERQERIKKHEKERQIIESQY